MSWILYGAAAYAVYKLAQSGQLSLKDDKPKKRRKKKRKKRTPARPAHEVLGVDADASPDEVRHAYQTGMTPNWTARQLLAKHYAKQHNVDLGVADRKVREAVGTK